VDLFIFGFFLDSFLCAHFVLQVPGLFDPLTSFTNSLTCSPIPSIEHSAALFDITSSKVTVLFDRKTTAVAALKENNQNKMACNVLFVDDFFVLGKTCQVSIRKNIPNNNDEVVDGLELTLSTDAVLMLGDTIST